MKDNEHSGSGELEEKTKRQYVNQFLQYSKSTHFENVLELGADNGRLAKILINNADIENYYCVEPNKDMHLILSRIPGVVVFETLAEALHAQIKYDAIIAVHVLDHIRDLSETLDLIENISADEAVIYAVVHNERSFLARLFGRRWPAYCLQHPHLQS